MKISKEERMGICKVRCVLGEITDDKTACKLVASLLRSAEEIVTLCFEGDHDFDDPVYDWRKEFKDGKELLANAKKVNLEDGLLDISFVMSGKQVSGLVLRKKDDGTHVVVSSVSEENVDKMARVIKQFVSKLKSE